MNGKSKPYIPLVCPRIKECEDYIEEGVFKGFCCTKNWATCYQNEELAKKLGLLKKPRDWE